MAAPDDPHTASSAEMPDDMATIRVTQSASSAVPDDLETLIVSKPAASQMPSVAASSANPDAPVPFVFGRRIAQGGMGAILEASDCKLGRTIAVKVMLQEAGCSEEQKQRFIQEAAVLGRLEHPNIVPIHDLGRDSEGQLYYTMKLVKGRTLQHILDDLRHEKPEALQHYTLDRLLTIFRKVCDALAFAHAHKIIHRDLKPENIMVGVFGEVLVMDWGISKILDGSADSLRGFAVPARSGSDPVSGHECPRSSTASFTATMDGAVMGTPNYMSPEQAMGKVNEMDARSDIFSLGGILYCILTLRPPVEGKDVWEVLEKVSSANITAPTLFGATVTNGKASAKGEVLEAKKITPLPHVPGGKVPSALSAVAMKALTLDKARRYQNIAAFSADIEKYQGGFATTAENAGAWKQFTLLMKRNKAASLGVAAVLLVGASLGTKALLEGRRAERALADLKKQAPALRQMADSEATFQRFDSALEKLDAALSLDPTHLPSYWRRAWLFIGMNRLPEAAAATRLAQQKDPARRELAAILPTVEKLAALPVDAPWPPEEGGQLWQHLTKAGAGGETLAISARLKLGAKDKEKLVRQRLEEWLGKGKGSVGTDSSGLVGVTLTRQPIDTIEPLRGLPIDELDIADTRVTSLEQLRGMRLVTLSMHNCRITDLSPLRGSPLRSFSMNGGLVTDFSPLRGAPLLYLAMTGAPVRDLSFLEDSPLEHLSLWHTQVADLSPLRGKPLKFLNVRSGRVSDLSPLRGAPIQMLEIEGNPLTDLSPLLDLPKLEKLRIGKLGSLLEPLRKHPSLKFIAENQEDYRPVAAVWAAWEKEQAAAAAVRKEAAAAGLNPRDIRFENLPDGTRLVVIDAKKPGAIPALDWTNVSKLSMSNSPISDLSPLRGVPLKVINLRNTRVTSLEPLRGMPLIRINLIDTRVTDLAPLLDCPELESICLPRGAKDLATLKRLPKLKYLGYEEAGPPTYFADRTAEQFWAEYDAQQAAGKK